MYLIFSILSLYSTSYYTYFVCLKIIVIYIMLSLYNFKVVRASAKKNIESCFTKNKAKGGRNQAIHA